MYKIDFRIEQIYNPHCVNWMYCVERGLLKLPVDCRRCRYNIRGESIVNERIWRQECDKYLK